jgi:hypothetical protein
MNAKELFEAHSRYEAAKDLTDELHTERLVYFEYLILRNALDDIPALLKEIKELYSYDPFILRLKIEEYQKDAAKQSACIKKLVDKVTALGKEKQALIIRAKKAEAEIDAMLRQCTCAFRHHYCKRGGEVDGCDSDDCEDAQWRGAPEDTADG